jgi:hypothetical protein
MSPSWDDYSGNWNILDPKRLDAYVNETTFNVNVFNEFMYNTDELPPHLDPLIMLRNLFPDGMWNTQAFDERLWDDDKGEPPVKFLVSHPEPDKTEITINRLHVISKFLYDKFRGLFLKEDFETFTEIRSIYDEKFKELPTETTKFFFKLLDLLLNLRKYPINLDANTNEELLETNETKIEIISKLMELDQNTRQLAISEKENIIKFFELVIDLPAFWSNDHQRLRSFFIDWYSALRSISTRSKNATDIYNLSQDELNELIKSFGFPYPWDVERSRKAVFLQNLLSLYKYKGTPRAFITALNYLGIENIILIEWYIDRIDNTAVNETFNLDNPSDLERYKEKVKFFAKGKPIYPLEYINDEKYIKTISYEQFIKDNPFWQMDKDSNGEWDDDNIDSIYKLYYKSEITLPSITSIVTVDTQVELGNYPADKAILRRKIQEDYEYWLRNVLIKNGDNFTTRKVIKVIQSWNELDPWYIPNFVYEKAIKENFRIADYVGLVEYTDSTGGTWFGTESDYDGTNYEYLTENNKNSSVAKLALINAGLAHNIVRDAKDGDLILVDPDSDDEYFDFRNNRGYFLEYTDSTENFGSWTRSSTLPQVNEIITELESDVHWICYDYSESTNPNYKWYNLSEKLPENILEGFYDGTSAVTGITDSSNYDRNGLPTIELFGYNYNNLPTLFQLYLAIDYVWNLRIRYNEDDIELLDPYFEYWKADSCFDSNRIYMYNGQFSPLDSDYDGDEDGFLIDQKGDINYDPIRQEFSAITSHIIGSEETVITGYFDNDNNYHAFEGHISDAQFELLRELGNIHQVADYWENDENYVRTYFSVRPESNEYIEETWRDVLGTQYYLDGTSYLELSSEYLDSPTGNLIPYNNSFTYRDLTAKEIWNNKIEQYFSRFTGQWFDGPKAGIYQQHIEDHPFNNVKRFFFETGSYLYAMNNSEQFLKIMNKDLYDYIQRDIWFREYDEELQKSINRVLLNLIKTFENYVVDRFGLENLATLSSICIGFSGYKNLKDIIEFFKPFRAKFASFSLHFNLSNPLLNQIVLDDRFNEDPYPSGLIFRNPLTRQLREVDYGGTQFPSGILMDGDWYTNHKKYQQVTDPNDPMYTNLGYQYDYYIENGKYYNKQPWMDNTSWFYDTTGGWYNPTYLKNPNKYYDNKIVKPDIQRPWNYTTVISNWDRNDYLEFDSTSNQYYIVAGENEEHSLIQTSWTYEENESGGWDYVKKPYRLCDEFSNVKFRFNFESNLDRLRDYDRTEFLLSDRILYNDSTSGKWNFLDSTGFEPVDTEKVRNGNFTSWVDPYIPLHWETYDEGKEFGSILITKHEDSHSSNDIYSARMILTDSNYKGKLIQKYNVTSGYTYIISGWCKLLDGEGDGIIKISDHPSKTKFWNNKLNTWTVGEYSYHINLNKNEWTYFEIDLNIDPGISAIKLELIASDSKYDILWDEISVIERYYKSVFENYTIKKDWIPDYKNSFKIPSSIDYRKYYYETSYFDSTTGEFLFKKDKFLIKSIDNFYEYSSESSKQLDMSLATDDGYVEIYETTDSTARLLEIVDLIN